MLKWLKQLVAKYDVWCDSMGLTPENKRSCVPYRSDPSPEAEQKNQAEK